MRTISITHRIIFISSCENQGVGSIVAPAMNSSYMWPVGTRLTDLTMQKCNRRQENPCFTQTNILESSCTSKTMQSHVPSREKVTDLHSELPEGSHWHTRDRAIVVGGDNCALLCAPNTGHTLQWEGESATLYKILNQEVFLCFTPFNPSGLPPQRKISISFCY